MNQLTSEVRTAVSKPLYGQVREMLLARIGCGEWGPGDSLPNEFILANQFSVSVGTIRRAIEGLEDSGVVVRKQGRGTYVSGQGTHALENRFTTLRSPTGRPLQLSYRVVDVTRRAASLTERGRLMCADKEDVIEVRQSVHNNARLIGMECAVVSAADFPNLASKPSDGQHLYALYSEQGVLITRTEERISASTAENSLAEFLEVSPGHPFSKWIDWRTDSRAGRSSGALRFTTPWKLPAALPFEIDGFRQLKVDV